MVESTRARMPGFDLVARIRAGDEQAFEALFREYYKPLRRYALAIVRRADLAEDVVQAVFLRLWTGRQDWVLRSSVKAYLYSAVHHRALQLLRHERVEDRHVIAVLRQQDEAEATPTDQGPDSQLASEELSRRLQSTIDRLAPRTREAFELHRHHELSYQEIAKVMGISVKTVGVHMSRALAALRKAIVPYLVLQLLLIC